MYPEYVGVLLSEIHKIVDRPESAQAAYELAKKLEQRRNFTLLEQTKLSNDNALAVLKSVGARARHRQHRRPQAAAARRARRRRAGVPHALRGADRPARALRAEAADEDRRRPNTGEQYPALDERQVVAASVFTTDSQLAGGRYTLLDDPKGVFATHTSRR